MPRGEGVEARLASVLASRVDRIMLVLECVTDNRNFLGILRTCDVLGVQRVAVIHAPAGGHAHHNMEHGRKKGRIARASSSWLDIQHFSSSGDAIAELKAQGWTIWATDLTPGALSLHAPDLQLPQRLAIVMGSESSGISSEMRQAADRCVYLPMFGFTESLNVGIASALVLQALIGADPSVRGQLLGGEGRSQELDSKWRAAVASRSGGGSGGSGGGGSGGGGGGKQQQHQKQKHQKQKRQLEQPEEQPQQEGQADQPPAQQQQQQQPPGKQRPPSPSQQQQSRLQQPPEQQQQEQQPPGGVPELEPLSAQQC